MVTKMDIDPGNCIFSKITLCTKESFDLLSEIWGHIPDHEKTVICNQLGIINFVHYNTLTETQLKVLDITPTEGGATAEKDGKCSVRIDMSRSPEIIKTSIAHELAHVFFNHPVNNADRLTAEEEANSKAKEWGYTYEK
jgi:hypothetical protein